MNLKLTIIFAAFLIHNSSCSNVNDPEYGNILFESEYDGLMHVDKLWLFDNGAFKIDMIEVETNGTFQLKGDTIFLEYGNFQSNTYQTFLKGNAYQAFIIEDGFVNELTRQGRQWNVGSRNRSMGIYLNKLHSVSKVSSFK